MKHYLALELRIIKGIFGNFDLDLDLEDNCETIAIVLSMALTRRGNISGTRLAQLARLQRGPHRCCTREDAIQRERKKMGAMIMFFGISYLLLAKIRSGVGV